MQKKDIKKVYKQLFTGKPGIITDVEVPEFTYLMVDGRGNPNNNEDFSQKVEWLFGLSYTIKFMIAKASKADDYVVGPLEGLWWAEDMQSFSVLDKDAWKWTIMIQQPNNLTTEMFKLALETFVHKKKLHKEPEVRMENYAEGSCVQVMHIGSFADEAPLIQQMHNRIAEMGCKFGGKHHEIYLSDFRKTSPEKLKTIIRQPYM